MIEGRVDGSPGFASTRAFRHPGWFGWVCEADFDDILTMPNDKRVIGRSDKVEM